VIQSEASLLSGLVSRSFNLQNGIYTSGLTDGAMAIAVNLWCIALGIAIAVVVRLPSI
jgi:hypothetical protein